MLAHMPIADHFADHIDRRVVARSVANAEAAAIAGAAGLAGAFLLSADKIENGPVICPFRLATGLPCPGCGLTRSWVYLTHGQFTDSVMANPFGVVSAALVIALVVAVVSARVRRGQPPQLDAVVRRPWMLIVVAAWLAFATGRSLFAFAA